MYKKYFKYLKHIIISDIGIEGQDILNKKKFLCIGTGGLGSPVLTYLTLAGIRNIGISDFDIVEITNLNRQFIFNENDLKKKKIECAKKYIKKINKNINLILHKKKISNENSFNIMKNYDLVIDCTDNLESKMLISDSAISLNIPVIHASVFGLQGYITLFKKGVFCYRCLYENYKNLEYIEYGILGAVAGTIGCIQAIESIKYFLPKKTYTENKKIESNILMFNFKSMNIKILKVKKNEKCSIC